MVVGGADVVVNGANVDGNVDNGVDVVGVVNFKHSSCRLNRSRFCWRAEKMFINQITFISIKLLVIIGTKNTFSILGALL